MLVGVPSGAWTTKLAHQPAASPVVLRNRHGHVVDVWQSTDDAVSWHIEGGDVFSQEEAAKAAGVAPKTCEATVSCPNGSDTYQQRTIAIDKAGRVVIGREWIHSNGGAEIFDSALFPFPLSNVQRFELQTRPYRWAEFQNVLLLPRSISELHAAAGAKRVSATSMASAEAYMSTQTAFTPLTVAKLIEQGCQLQRQGQAKDGIPDFRAAVALAPNNAVAQFQLASALFNINSETVRSSK